MNVILLLLFLGVAGLMILMILLQEGKGGGLTGMSSGMDQVMGARNPLRRWTAYFFVAFVLIAIFINWRLFARGQHAIPEGDPDHRQPAATAPVIPVTGPVTESSDENPMFAPPPVLGFPGGEAEGTETANPPPETETPPVE